MNHLNLKNELSRTTKILIDSGKANTLEEAEKLSSSFKLRVLVGPEIKNSPTLQAALLTIVNTARRCCLGGVKIEGNLDVPLLLNWRNSRTVAEAVIDLKGELTSSTDPTIPTIFIGEAKGSCESKLAVRVTFNGWTGGVVPITSTQQLAEKIEFTPTGVLIGALAVSEVFQHWCETNPYAGRRKIGLSLWKPEIGDNWISSSEFGPDTLILPKELWLIGLGHLGQAFLWTIGFLPYLNPGDLLLLLQDYDDISEANDSTSLLTTPTLIGQKKPRAMANLCEVRGFRTLISERKFSDNLRRENDEPGLALCGVDNKFARSKLEKVGFMRIIEAGLGTGANEYLDFQMHTFPSNLTAEERWSGAEKPINSELLNQPAYQALSKAGVDDCGLVNLADRSVGASFVGACVSTLVISEVIRSVMGEHCYEVLDGSFRNLSDISVVNNLVAGTPSFPYTKNIR